MARGTDSIAELLGVLPEKIIYTSGASESNNLALKGIVQASRHVGKRNISTALEHSSVGGALSALQQQGCEIDPVDIRRDGAIDLEHLRELLRKDTVLVVCAVDSELGGGNALQSGVRREPRPEKRALVVAHQSQPPDDRGGDHRISANF